MYESINEFGNFQTYDEEDTKVCSCCGCMYINFGKGTACSSCANEILIECERDYDEGLL